MRGEGSIRQPPKAFVGEMSRESHAQGWSSNRLRSEVDDSASFDNGEKFSFAFLLFQALDRSRDQEAYRMCQ